MATLNLTKTIPKTYHAKAAAPRNQWNPRVVSFPRRPLQANLSNDAKDAYGKASEAVKQTADGALKTGHDLKDQAIFSAGQVDQKVKDTASNVADVAQGLTEKVKDAASSVGDTAQDAWESAKDTAEKIKDTVIEKTEDTKEFVKEKL